MGAEQTKQQESDEAQREKTEDAEEAARKGADTVLFIRKLALEYLDSVMNEDLTGASSLTRRESMNVQSEEQRSSEKTTELLKELLVIFERSSEPLLYTLVITVNIIRDSQESHGADRFIERISSLFADEDWKSCQGFATTVLEGLLRRSDRKFVPEVIREPQYCGLKISLSEKSMDVSFEDILTCFWTDWLDTDCHWCRKPFAPSEPPIRTIAAFEESAESAQEIHIRVYNRHWSCMRHSDAQYVPISHVWDPAIREAHASREYNSKAASTIVSVIDTLLKSSKRSYEDGTEFWHDYVSVPQWNTQVQQGLLLLLPSLYSDASEILVDLHDVPTRHIAEILVEANRDWENPLYQSLKAMVPLRSLHSSQWMERMWVTLEYSKSKAACVIDESGFLWRTEKDETFFSRDSFTVLANAADEVVRKMMQYAPSFGYDIREGSSLGNLTIREEEMGAHETSLGEAIKLLQAKNCQYDRDRFLAAHVMATSSQSGGSANVPLGAMEAYVWVQHAALQRGDYSPLLFHPLYKTETVPLSGIPSWILDGQDLRRMEFELGAQISPPDLAIHSVAVDGNSVEVPLNSVGVIEDIQYLDMVCTTVEVVDRAISLLTITGDGGGRQISVEMLIDSLNCIFPLLFSPAMRQNLPKILAALEASPDLAPQTVSNIGLGKVNTLFRELQEQNPGQIGRFEEIMTRYAGAQSGPTGQKQRESAAAEISDILELNREVSIELQAPITRLITSAGIAEKRRQEGETEGEPICRITCTGCSVSFWLRLDLRSNAKIGAKVYHIKGLTYASSVDNGVGLVIQDNGIVGRMLYGTPKCGCNVQEVVQIK